MVRMNNFGFTEKKLAEKKKYLLNSGTVLLMINVQPE
jgi:hypothetical protein